RPVKSPVRPHDRDELVILWKGAEVVFEEDVIAAGGELGREAIFHAEYLGIPDQIGDVAVDFLVMGNEETVAIDRTGVVVGVAGMERIGLAVEPGPLGLIRIDLTYHRHIIGHSPL